MTQGFNAKTQARKAGLSIWQILGGDIPPTRLGRRSAAIAERCAWGSASWFRAALRAAQRGALGIADAAEQTRAVLEIIQSAVESLGGRLSDVVRTRIYVKDIALWESVARVHGEFFADIRPACTLVEARLVDDSLLVEIEAEAVVGSGDAV